MIKRVGRPPIRGKRYSLRPGAYAILPLGSQILLTEQSVPAYDIQLPGGGIDPGESALQALHREVLEETGWRISQPRRLGAFRRFAYMPEYDLWAEKLCLVYLARPVLKLRPPSEPHHQGLLLPPGQAARQLGNAGDRMFLQHYLRRQG